MDELSEHLDFPSCRDRFKDTHLHHDLTTQSFLNLLIIRILVGTEILNQIGFRLVIFLAVGDIHFDVLPRLVRKLCEHLCFFPAEETSR